MTRLNNNQQKKKRICKIVDFAVTADHRIKPKEYEKKDKYLNLAREWKKLWTMQEELEVETIQTTALLRTAKILRRILETWGDLLSLRLQWKTIG